MPFGKIFVFSDHVLVLVGFSFCAEMKIWQTENGVDTGGAKAKEHSLTFTRNFATKRSILMFICVVRYIFIVKISDRHCCNVDMDCSS